jgi:hypothetical protein
MIPVEWCVGGAGLLPIYEWDGPCSDDGLGSLSAEWGQLWILVYTLNFTAYHASARVILRDC